MKNPSRNFLGTTQYEISNDNAWRLCIAYPYNKVDDKSHKNSTLDFVVLLLLGVDDWEL